MRLKKSIFGCIIWILFIGTIIAAITQNIYVFSFTLPKDRWLIEGLILGCIFVAIIGMLLIMRNVAFQIQKRGAFSPRQDKIIECVGMTCLIVFIFGVRIYYLMNGMNGAIAENEFYNSAIVGSQYDRNTFTVLSNIYIYLLSILFSLLGNRILIAVYFQLILQGVTILLTYFIVKHINGKVAGFVVSFVLALSYPFINEITKITPVHLLLFMIVLMMWYMTAVWKVILRGKANKILQFILVLFVCILTGFLCYIDLFGVYFLIIGVVGLLLCELTDGTKKSNGTTMIVSGGYILGSVVSFIVFLLVDSMIKGSDFLTACIGFGNSIIDSFHVQLTYIFPSLSFEISMGMLFLAASWAVSYWLAKKDENILYSLFLLCSISCSLFVHGEINHELLVQFAWVLVTVIPVISICTCYSSEQPGEVKKMELMPENVQAEKIQTEEKVQEEQREREQPEATEKVFVPIPNPLPLPKQHIHKEMDYGIEIEESDMHYDLEDISEDDDYDLK